MLFASLKNTGGLNAAGTRNYGIQVNMIGQRNVAAVCFLAKHTLHRLDRPLTHADIQTAKGSGDAGTRGETLGPCHCARV
jgi:hypothetical protein